jgi:hypothetical protein
MKKDSTSTAKVGISVVLGVTACLVFFVAGAVTEVPGENSIREIVASCLVGALYLGFCQFWVAPRDSIGFRAKWPTLAAMILPLLCVVVLIFLVEHGSLVAGAPWLVSGCLGSLVGAMTAGRVGTQSLLEAPSAEASSRIRNCRRFLLVGVAILVGVSLLVVVGVTPPLMADPPCTHGFRAHGAAVTLRVFAALNLLVAVMLAFVALRPGVCDRYSKGTLGAPAVLALLLAFFYAMASGIIRSDCPTLGTASVLLVVCAVSDLVTAVLVTAASVVAHRALKAGG